MLHVDVWDLCVHAYVSKDLRHLIVTEYLPYAYSYSCHTLGTLCGRGPERQLWCSSETHGVYWGVICDLGWSLVNMVLLRWSCQSHSQSGKKTGREWRHTLSEREREEGKTSIPSSQSPSTEPLKWCRFSLCRAELGEGGPNVTVKSLPVNYHKRLDGLEHCCWTLGCSEMTILLV